MNDPEQLIETFRKMQLHCNVLEDLDPIGDMNNASKLREVLRNEAYILAITAEKNRALGEELRKVRQAQGNLARENTEMQKRNTEMRQRTQKLDHEVGDLRAKLYEIEFDTY